MKESSQVPENHPVRRVFENLTERALIQSSLPDRDLLAYMSDLLVDFMWTKNLYRLKDEDGETLVYLIDMFDRVAQMPRRARKQHYKQIGDYTMFVLGMFPGSLSYGRRCISASYYCDAGRKSYRAAGELVNRRSETVTYRKLADKYEACVFSLKLVREYTSDPFYQYMLREFEIT